MPEKLSPTAIPLSCIREYIFYHFKESGEYADPH